MPTLILKVDLECCKCNKKIRKVLCELQEKWKIQSIIYDEKAGTITISGPFDPKNLSKKLCRKACKVILDIKEPEPPAPAPPPAEPTPPPADPTPPPPAEPTPPPAEPTPPPPPPPAEPTPPPPAEPTPPPPPAEPTPPPAEPTPPPPPAEPTPPPPPQPEAPKCWAPVFLQPVMPYYPTTCCCWYHGRCQCCSCGRSNGWAPPAPPAVYGGPCCEDYKTRPCYDSFKTCELICEEDGSCTIM